ncbi:LacI family DNA-binding transcriptional regulator [Aquimonas sp.]|jgi:LacI family transcriptional regulator|uniref:LacI family DNA-binding transcriptional regulator n=1 Tax=Aquimonas sp. TaxID=1872588 RepID=UPI0037C14A7B
MNRAIIDDVAAAAGVSIKTVSRVVNREPRVRPETRARVEAAIASLNYRPRMSARGLAGNRSYMLGLIYGRPGAHYVLDIQEGILEVCRSLGYELVIHPADIHDVALSGEVEELILNKRIDGVLLSPPISDHLGIIDLLHAAEIPLVRIAPTAHKQAHPFVETNDLEAALALTRCLIEHGHRRIAFITGHPDHRAIGLRYEGYRQALAEASIAVRDDWVIDGDLRFDSGERAGRQLLALVEPPTAVFAANDEMAGGVIKAAHALGLRIPDQLSVVGFDDAPISRQLWPSLTTIRQPIRDMARTATRLLLGQLRSEDISELLSLHPAEIVLRESVAAPRQA